MFHRTRILLRLISLITVLSKSSIAEICSGTCHYDLVVSMQFSHIYQVSESPYSWHDVGLDEGTGHLVVVNSTFRPGTESPIGDVVPDPMSVITLDGYGRRVYIINNQFPGPVLEFTEGSKVFIKVTNKLDDDVLTMHMHGFLHTNNVWMDGAARITQCPISPGESFTYSFIAPHAGTYWYHSHTKYQLSDGCSGMIIIHPKSYAPTMPSFNVQIQEWYHALGSDYHYTYPLAVPAERASGMDLWYALSTFQQFNTLADGSGSVVVQISSLINGRGRFKADEKWPLHRFAVKSNTENLFHVTNSGGENPLIISVDSHKLKVVGVDSREVIPFITDAVILFIGERVDFVIETNQPSDCYWMRTKVFQDEFKHGVAGQSLAILEYDGHSCPGEPTSQPKQCTDMDKCIHFLCPFKHYPDFFNTECLHLSGAQRLYTYQERHYFGLNQVLPDKEFFLNTMAAMGNTFNAKYFVYPTAPYFQSDSEGVSCEPCQDDVQCSCTFTLDVPYDKVIDFVISNRVPPGAPNLPHPIHLHGHNFAVIKMGFPDYKYNETVLSEEPHPDITCNNEICTRPSWTNGVRPPGFNLDTPPLKDTIPIPNSGYVVIRFRSDNPGPWMLHCHFLHHTDQGPMIAIIEVAKDRYPPVPPSFPTCTHNFSLSENDFDHYMYRAQEAAKYPEGFEQVSPDYCLPDETQDEEGTRPSLHSGNDDLELTVGGLTGTIMAALLGGLLVGVLVTACCALICCKRRPVRLVPSVSPQSPTYITRGPVMAFQQQAPRVVPGF